MTQLCNINDSKCCELSESLNPLLFKALCEPMRIGLLARLSQMSQPATVSQIASCCPIDLSVVSRHLAILRDCGVLKAEKRGKEVWYSVRYNELAAKLREMADVLDACCPKEEVPHERCCNT